MKIRHAGEADLEHMVAVHMAAFPGFFLTQLGAAFLHELYRGFIRDPKGICLVAERHDEVLGFLAGTNDPEGFFFCMLRRRWWRFSLASVPVLWRAPLSVGRRLISAIWYRGDRPESVLNGALLSSIAVRPDLAGSGVGRALVAAFFEVVQGVGGEYVYLVTDRDGNDATNKFYEKMGFEVESSFQKRPGRWMSRYIKHLERERPTT